MKILLFLLSVILSGCVNTEYSDVGEWVQMQDSIGESYYIDKYEMVGFNDIFEGLVFWEISPRIDTAPYSFHIAFETIYLWIPNGLKMKRYKLGFSQCPDLESKTSQLIDSIQSSTKKMTDDRVKYQAEEIMVGSPPTYRVKYFPANMLGSLTLNNLAWDDIPWMEKALEVKEIANKCL